MRLMSAVDSRSPIWISLLKSGMGWPPRCRTATSKDTLVRLLGLWKIMARLRPASGRPGSAPAFSAEATSRTSVISAAERSAIEIRSRPAREPIWGLCSHPTPPAACGSRNSPLHHCYGYARNESAGAGVGPSGGDPAGLAAAADARRRVPRGAPPLRRPPPAGPPGAERPRARAPAAAPVARALAGVGEVITLRGLDPSASPIQGLLAWARLRRMRFDIAVICGTAARPRILVYRGGFPRRLGVGGGLTAALLSDHVAPRSGENQSVTWLRLAHLLGITAERHEARLDPG